MGTSSLALTGITCTGEDAGIGFQGYGFAVFERIGGDASLWQTRIRTVEGVIQGSIRGAAQGQAKSRAHRPAWLI